MFTARPRTEIGATDATSAPSPTERRLARPAAFARLAKLRISALVLITTAVGYLVAIDGPVEPGRMIAALLGTALAATGANALNQVFERRLDARMKRTRERPLPTGQLGTIEATVFGVLVSIIGTAVLTIWVNALTAALGLLTVVLYAFVYTPLKRKTSLCTIIGAIPGATPPVMGVTAASGALGETSLWLFLVLFAWQMPHFYAIAWIYRDDYRKGGFPMLPVVDKTGRRTAIESIFFVLLMASASAMPALRGSAGPAYLAAAVALGGLYLAAVLRFVTRPEKSSARRVFIVSILTLPAQLGMMVLDWA